jgi:hypothetical protein
MGRKGKRSVLTIDEAFQQFYLQEKDDPHGACERFNQALRDGLPHGLPLWCDGKEVEPDYFASYFRVWIKQAPDGGWTAKMKTKATAGMPPADQFKWTVSASAVGRFLKPKARRKPGPKPKGDWHTLLAQWLIAVAADDPKLLRNVAALVVEAAVFLQTEIGWAPAEAKDLRKKIDELLARVPR